ncbi:MAG TPA: NAD(P)(+) transhydrogenase (Re/Si-specific) subunit beta, partial [Candidatus Binatia bacterium]|nr:NAD(P)(+) transhydrogenase (Re/Si-specific) subunit beta [Candidatus Binatia bacterium]
MTVATALVYLLAAVLFILGLRFLSSPRTARHGNWVAAVGMGIAILWTLVLLRGAFTGAGIIISALGVVIGSVLGTLGARNVKMTAMPQMVAAFNGVGGGAAALVAVVELLRLAGERPDLALGLPSV